MTIIESLPEIRCVLQQVRASGKTIGFVPTMGALHAGHLQLLQTARAENEVVCCSIFVNPIQFNNAEDYQRYPRVQDEDLRLLEEQGCDEVQGYFTGRPRPIEDYATLVGRPPIRRLAAG